jgi:hypothetical protein
MEFLPLILEPFLFGSLFDSFDESPTLQLGGILMPNRDMKVFGGKRVLEVGALHVCR